MENKMKQLREEALKLFPKSAKLIAKHEKTGDYIDINDVEGAREMAAIEALRDLACDGLVFRMQEYKKELKKKRKALV